MPAPLNWTAAVAPRSRSAADPVEVRLTRTVAGAWLIERESASRRGLMYTITVGPDGDARHSDAPSGPSLLCPASAYGQTCKHLADAPALVEYAREIAGYLRDMAHQCTYAPEWRSEAYIALQRARIDVLLDEARRTLGVRIVAVTEEMR